MSRFYVASNGRPDGPYGLSELQSRGLAPDDLVWNEGMVDWLPAGRVPELSGVVPGQPPAPRQASYQPPQPAAYSPQAYAPHPQQAYAPPTYPAPGYAQHPQQGYYQPPAHQTTVYVQAAPQPVYYQRPVYVPQKSVGVAFLLTFLFGPLGMFYSTVGGALTMLFASIVLAVLTAGISILITYPLCIIWGCVAASTYNEQMRRY